MVIHLARVDEVTWPRELPEISSLAWFLISFTVHCLLDILGHQSVVRPDNGTGFNSVRSKLCRDNLIALFPTCVFKHLSIFILVFYSCLLPSASQMIHIWRERWVLMDCKENVDHRDSLYLYILQQWHVTWCFAPLLLGILFSSNILKAHEKILRTRVLTN